MTTEHIIETMRTCRHTLHAHPETAFEEHQTANYIASVLKQAGIEVHEHVGKTGLVAVLTNGEGPQLGLRADMDALPVTEENQCAHRSTINGKMHACGHDGHSSMLLGAALYLHANRNWKGTIHCIFQPAEEAAGGGQVMIDDGLFERFPCDAVFGLHNWPGIPLGQFAINPGAMMAAQDLFEITVTGKGAHAAMPETGVDSLLIASQIVLNLQTIRSRKISPSDAAVLTVTQIHGGDAWNVIPDTAVIRGTVRCFDENLQNMIEQQLTTIANDTAHMQGGTVDVRYMRSYPATINHPAQAEIAKAAAAKTVGDDHVLTNVKPAMPSEDFSFMLRAKPGAYIWMGIDGETPSAKLHNPHYDFNDDGLEIGMRYWINLAEMFCPA
jgi:amidohydrolase